MPTYPWRVAIAGALLASLFICEPAFAQKPGGVLRMPMGTSPASMSIHEESTIAALGPMMGVFNNLVMFDNPATTILAFAAGKFDRTGQGITSLPLMKQ